jgi:serine/threonine-protein kinase
VVSTQTQQHEIGTDFVGYRIEALIGRGAMGVVYRAYDLRLKRTVALKLIAPELVRDARFRTRFGRETELAMSLEHPNVVPIYDAGDVDGRLYLAMRLVEGSDLRTLLRSEGPLAPARAFAICRQVGAALDAGHANGLLHCDVKPSNVLLDRDEHVYVADLGIGRRLEEQAALAPDERSVGTPAYLAPEHIEGSAIDARADVYSLGCLLYECLTGELPFSRDSRLAMAWAHLEDEPPSASERNASLPPAVDAVLKKAMAKSTAERYASCAAFMDDVRQALGLGRPPTVRRRLLVVAAAIVIVLGAGAVAVFAFRDSGGAAASPKVRPNTLVRIDPATNKITHVIDVRAWPSATAVGGGSVWVYHHADSLSEIDPKTNRVLHTETLRAAPDSIGLPFGPILDADGRGAWVIGVDLQGAGFVTNVRPGGRGTRAYRLGVDPKAVAVGEGAVWVLGSGRTGDQLLRLDPRTGTVTARKRLRRSLVTHSLTAGLGSVWVVASLRGMLYRIDPRMLAVTGQVFLGKDAARPTIIDGQIWVGVETGDGESMIVDPRSLAVNSLPCCSPREGSDAAGFGSDWMISWPTGVVVRWDAPQLAATIRVTEPPVYGGPCLTWIAAGAGAVWVTVGPSGGEYCTA